MGGRKITRRVDVPDGVGKTSLRASGAPTEFESELTKSGTIPRWRTFSTLHLPSPSVVRAEWARGHLIKKSKSSPFAMVLMRLTPVHFHLFRGRAAALLSNLASYQIGKRHSCEVLTPPVRARAEVRLGPTSKAKPVEYVLRQSNPIHG